MRYSSVHGNNVTKILTAANAAAGGVPLNHVGLAPGFPIAETIPLGPIEPGPAAWFAPVSGVWEILASLTRDDASSSTFFQHQIVFMRPSIDPLAVLPAWDSIAESPNDFGGVISGFTPAVHWIGRLDQGDAVVQLVHHEAPGPIACAGAVTITYLGNNATPDGTTTPWGPIPAVDLPSPAGTTYGPPV